MTTKEKKNFIRKDDTQIREAFQIFFPFLPQTISYFDSALVDFYTSFVKRPEMHVATLRETLLIAKLQHTPIS